MTLACPMIHDDSVPSPIVIALHVFAIAAPLVAFALLPKRMAIARELRFAAATALWPLAWLASRRAGHAEEAASWGPRLRAAIARAVERAHPAGESGDVVRDPVLLRRARMAGAIASAMPAALLCAVLPRVLETSDPSVVAKFVAASVAPLVVTTWLTFVIACAGAIFAQAFALGPADELGRGTLRRAFGGALVGAGYGGLGGFFTGVLGMALFAPVMSLLTGDPPRGYDAFLLYLCAGAGSAVLGGAAGILLLTPLALATRRRWADEINRL
jgi:hypothetical protein